MPTALPQRLDLAWFADAQAALEGEVPLAQFRRLAPLLARTEGVVQVRLVFTRESEHEAVDGRLESELILTCQRCFGEVRVPVTAVVRLIRVANAAEAEALEGDRDPLIAPNREIETTALLEDELLLALPLVVRHADRTECGAVAADGTLIDATAKTEHPFAALAALKKH